MYKFMHDLNEEILRLKRERQEYKEEKMVEAKCSLLEQAISYKQQLRFYQEHHGVPIKKLQNVILRAEKTEEFLSYAKVEKNYLALSKFRLFVADKIVSENAPHSSPVLGAIPRSPNIRPKEPDIEMAEQIPNLDLKS